jgi:hypothetical protein
MKLQLGIFPSVILILINFPFDIRVHYIRSKYCPYRRSKQRSSEALYSKLYYYLKLVWSLGRRSLRPTGEGRREEGHSSVRANRSKNRRRLFLAAWPLNPADFSSYTIRAWRWRQLYSLLWRLPTRLDGAITTVWEIGDMKTSGLIQNIIFHSWDSNR